MPLHPVTGKFYEEMTKEITVITPPGSSDRGILRRLKHRNFVTPDMSKLKLVKSIPLFVYGTDMKNGNDHGVLEGAKYLGKGHTLSKKFWMKQTTINPIVFDSVTEGHKDNRQVRGEVYEVQVEHIHLLDVMHRNMISTRRTSRNIVFEDCNPTNGRLHQLKGFSVVNCFMYVGSKHYWKDYELRHRMVESRVKKEGIEDVPFYEWVNWVPDDDDEWGWYGRWTGNHEHGMI
jgi:gamma-glutamylcyclotransferase (GGCT)/AIG2-like uncharacterized protein YtfP